MEIIKPSCVSWMVLLNIIITNILLSSSKHHEKYNIKTNISKYLKKEDQILKENSSPKLDSFTTDQKISTEIEYVEKNSTFKNSTFENSEFKNSSIIFDKNGWSSWLMNVPLDSTLPKNRTRRRFLHFPWGSYLNVSF